ncbi:MAG: proton-conducting transporter membrane subunit [Desulfurivibrionaceae bacterium]
MDTFFLAIGVILAAGVLPLTISRQFKLMKSSCLLLMAAGCVIGLSEVLSFLANSGEAAAANWAWLHIFTLSFKLDTISAFFLIPVFLISPLALLYSFHYLEKPEQSIRTALNYFCYAILVASMALVATANNIVTFALAWELMSLSSFFLVVYEYQARETRRAGYLYFIFAQGGAMFLFAAFGLIYSHTNSFSFEQVAAIPENIKLLVFILAFIGFGSKAGIFPLHIWLPHAHPAAPSHISAVMSGGMIKMGIYGIVRIYSLLGSVDMTFAVIVLVAGMITGVLGVVYALGKQDMKKMLAYSSVENIGIILMGLGIGMVGVAGGVKTMAFFGFAGAFLHVFNHAIFKSLLFMGAGAVLHKTGTRSINQLGGLMKRMPTTGKSFLAGSIAISGLPPFNGFIGEFLIYFGAFQGLGLHGLPFVLTTLTIISLAVVGGLATACFTKAVGLAFLGEPRSEAAANAGEAGFTMQLVMVLLAASCLLIGIFPEPFVQLAFNGLRDLNLVGAADPGLFLTLVRNIAMTASLFLALIITITLLRRMLYVRKQVERGPTWGCGFTQPTVRMQYTGTSYAMSMVDFYRPFVPAKTVYSGISKIFPGVTTYETRVEDLAENYIHRGLIRPLVKYLHKLRWIQHGKIQLYIGYIVLAIVALLIFI